MATTSKEHQFTGPSGSAQPPAQRVLAAPPPAPPVPPPNWSKPMPRRRAEPIQPKLALPPKPLGPTRIGTLPATAVPPAPPLPPPNWRRRRPQRVAQPPPPPPPPLPPPNWKRARALRPAPVVRSPPPRGVRRRQPAQQPPQRTPRQVKTPAVEHKRPVDTPPRAGGRLKYERPGFRGAQKNKPALNGGKPNLQERYRRRLLKLVNEQRARFGVPPVALDPVLNACARRHNADLAFVQRRLSHTGADGARLSERLARCGYTFKYASENVARGQGDPPHVIRSWMRSPGHRKNLLNPRAQHMGVHVGRGRDGRLYWAQMFGAAR